MEINELVGFKLIEIQKTGAFIKLFFKGSGKNQDFELSYKGLLFETSTSAINKQIAMIHLKSVLGFKAITQLRFQNVNPSEYQQLYIQMRGSTEDWKIELICVFKDYTLKRIASPHSYERRNKNPRLRETFAANTGTRQR
jgi:hypothetical protein